MFKRWYDIDPAVSAAVKKLEDAPEQLQIRCADFIIDKLRDYDFDIKMSLEDQYQYILQRWYDKNIKVSHAIEYLKQSPAQVRRELALEIIDYLRD
jgi:hypothetical protein